MDCCVDACMGCCIDSCMDSCMDPCTAPCMESCMDSCMQGEWILCFREWMLYGFFASRKRRMYHENQPLAPTENSCKIHATFIPPFIPPLIQPFAPPFNTTLQYHPSYQPFIPPLHTTIETTIHETKIQSNIQTKICFSFPVRIRTIGRHRAPYGFTGPRKLRQGRATFFRAPPRSIELRKV